MSIEKMRAEFVHAFVDRFGFGPMAASSNPDAAQMFEAAEWAWKASRAALVIYLPPAPYMPDSEAAEMTPYEIGEAQGRCDMWGRTREAIQATGVEVRP